MNLARTEEQRLLAENLRRYLAEENQFEHRRARLNANPPQRLALWQGLADMGVLGAAFPESCGGYAGDARSLALIQYELGRSLAVEPYLGSAVIAGSLLQAMQDSVEREAAIGELIAGTQIAVLAHDAGHQLYGLPRLQARLEGDSYRLTGRVRHVRHADVAHSFLVTARTADDELLILRLPAQDVSRQTYRLMDGAGGGDLIFSGQMVRASSRLLLRVSAQQALKTALNRGLLGLAAESLGLMDAANEATFQYLNTRKQFGVLIGTFQALQHRAADMYMAAQETHALLQLCIEAQERGEATQASALCSAVKALADTCGRRVGHEAIQMHGGMGVSDELNISHIGRRLATIRAELGGADLHRRQFGGLQPLETLLALQDSEAAQSWRAQVRDFTRQHLPADIARKGELGLKMDKSDYVRWQKILFEQHWFAGAWPQQYGGQGWDLLRQLIFTQESALNHAPMIIPYGVNMVGPVIYQYGSQTQKAEHLPAILSSDVWWCQGYSEPGSGSDLASLKTFAERDGDFYVINGAKMWTTEAHWADWMHCLVRTDRSGRPQQGISFLLIDMNTPGIEIKPIVTIDGIHHTNATFFDNVRVPVRNRVGEEGQGWSIAKFLLGNERVSIADTGPKLRLFKHVQKLYDELTQHGQLDAAQTALLGTHLADVAIQLTTLCAMERFYIEAWAQGAAVGAEASILKVRGTEVLQAISELALELEGPLAAAHDPHDLHLPADTQLNEAQQASLLGHEYLYGRCWSVFGGTNEIQRNLIARQVLGI